MSAEIKARMSLDSSGVKAGVESSGKAVSGLQGQLLKLGPQLAAAFSAGAIASFTKDVIEYGGRLMDLSDQTGLSTDELQAFQAAVMAAGGTVENSATAMMSLRNAQQAALSGEDSYIKTFARLNITMDDLAKKTMPQLLEAVAKNYKGILDFGVLVDLFGKKNAGRLEQALISLADEGFGGLIQQTKEAGLLLSNEEIFKMDAIADRWERWGIRMKVIGADIGFWVHGWVRKIGSFFDALKEAHFTKEDSLLKDWKNFFTGNFKEIDGPLKIAKRMKDNFLNSMASDSAIDQKEEEALKKKISDDAAKRDKVELDGRKGKIGDIYAAEAGEIQRLADKKAEADRKAAAAAAEKAAKQAALDEKAAAKAADAVEKEAQKLAALEAKTTLSEISGAAPEAARARYDSLREIGANILGSGRIGGAPQNREAEIATATRQTAENTARLVQKLDAPPVSRVAQSAPVY